jgi:hypothetical protein
VKWLVITLKASFPGTFLGYLGRLVRYSRPVYSSRQSQKKKGKMEKERNKMESSAAAGSDDG